MLFSGNCLELMMLIISMIFNVLWAIYLPLVTEIDARRVGFLYKIKLCNNSIMNFLFEVFGKHDLQILLTKYNITGLCSPRRFSFLACN